MELRNSHAAVRVRRVGTTWDAVKVGEGNQPPLHTCTTASDAVARAKAYLEVLEEQHLRHKSDLDAALDERGFPSDENTLE